MPKTLATNAQLANRLKRKAEELRKKGPGRPPRSPTSPPKPSEAPSTSRQPAGEARKQIANCAVPKPSAPRTVSRKKTRGRPTKPSGKSQTENESDSEDDVPTSFADVLKLVTQKVLETQREIRSIEDSFNNYRSPNEDTTILLMKFYAAVPKLHEKVAAGAKFDDDLLLSVFEELFPLNGNLPEKPKGEKHSKAQSSAVVSSSTENPPKKSQPPAKKRKH